MRKGLILLAFVAMGLPVTLFAQEKTETKSKDVQVITITRTGDKNEKTTIEVDGDKVKVNGKDVSDNKDVSVRVTKRGGNTHVTGPGSFTFSTDDFNFFREDPNRAMLGVVTEGKDKGVEVQSVTKESAAEKAGLKKGDVLKKIGDRKIESTDDVTEAIRAHKPGDKVAITYQRDGKEQKATAELDKYKGIAITAATMPRMPELRALRNLEVPMPPDAPLAGVWFGRPRLGLSIQDTDDGKGVKVLEVDDESLAGKSGVKTGDVITKIDDKSISSVDEVRSAMREKKDGETARLQVLRNGSTQNVEVKFPKKLKTADL